MSDVSVQDPATGKPRRLSEMCATCIMRPQGKRIGLPNERVTELIADARRADSYVVCHSTLPYGRVDDTVLPAICRGFADAYSTNFLRIMERLGGFVDVPPPSAGDNPADFGTLYKNHHWVRAKLGNGPAMRCVKCGDRWLPHQSAGDIRWCSRVPV